jgi:hypothetical protein
MLGPSKDAVPNSPEPEQSGCLSTIARIIWIMVGNFGLLVLMVLIIQRKAFSALDAAFWAVVGALLFIRYADIKWLKGQGPDAQPATMKDWGRYARLLFILAGGVWALSHIAILLLVR